MGDIEWVSPLAEGEAPPTGYIALKSYDEERYAVEIATLTRNSQFAEQVLAGLGDGECQVEEELPLPTERAKGEAVRALATWFRHHEKIEPSRIDIPMVISETIAPLFSDPWDLRLFETLCPVHGMFDLFEPQKLYALALLSTFLQVHPLTEAIATYFAFYIRRGVRETGQPTKLIRGWFHPDQKGEDYPPEKIAEMAEWMKEACKDMQLPNRKAEVE